jgi:hypothetical protein
MLANGPLAALPKQPRDLEVLLALGAARFEPGKAYSEAGVNDLLQKWLGPFCSPFGVDHVTFRRCLVDSGLLLRDKAGSTYRVGVNRLSKLIEDAARGVDPAGVMAELQRQREARKRARR